jgi:hypothetical protein
MDEIYTRMLICLNQKIARLSSHEKAAIFAWLEQLTGEMSLVGEDQQLNGQMQAWFSRLDLVEAIMRYRLILNRCQAVGKRPDFSGTDVWSGNQGVD